MGRIFITLSLMLCSLASATAAEFPAYQSQVLTDKLNQPWAIAVLSEEQLIISEMPGQLRLWSNGKLSGPLKGVPAVYHQSQGGLLDVKPHPDFIQNQWLYFSYASGDISSNALKLSRAKLVGNELQQLQELLTVAPKKDTPVHYGGRISFLPDNSLLLTSGDGFDYREKAQTLDNLLGKIIRINDDGTIPKNNPFVQQEGARGEIFSFGHRNPQGLVFDHQNQLIISHEHGPAGGDEINIIAPGKNYGWPVITYGKDYSGARISPFTEYPGMEQPLVNWTPSIAPSAMAIYRGHEFEQLNGDLLVTTLKDRNARWVQMDKSKVLAQQVIFAEFEQRLRDITINKKGEIYLITDAGNLIKITAKE